jgi:HD-GYP domain-containing protein (c-di-GMP phosphodiesterase class II)
MNGSNGPTILNNLGYQLSQIEDRDLQTLAMAKSLISLIGMRDQYTGSHSARVAKYVREIATQLGLPDNEKETMVFAAALHDIGKVAVPDHILLKPGKLSEEEFGWIQKYPEWGWMALRHLEGFQQAALLVLHHHEHVDGSGYPNRLRGEEIPLGSRIITVADSYDALTTNRPYRAALPQSEALAELIRCCGAQFDPQVVNAFCEALQREAIEKQLLADTKR